MIQRLATKPILLRIGLLLAFVVALGVVSMVASGITARTMEGLAAAVNLSGSLRMQSYRIGMALADPDLATSERADLVEGLATEFGVRLESPKLTGAVPRRAEDRVRAAYARVWHSWRDRMAPALATQLRALRGSADATAVGKGAAANPYLRAVAGFVTEIDALVGLLEARAEGRIARLRTIQGAALILTVLVVGFTLVLVALRVMVPLGELLQVADGARRGDFSGRTRFVGDDELGRVGAALNRMGEDLSLLYGDLEQRVGEKTRYLARSNRSLELLYRVGTRLHESPISEPLLKRILEDIQGRLGLGAVTLCLQGDPEPEQGRLIITTRSPLQQRGACTEAGCPACRDGVARGLLHLSVADAGRRPVACFPVGERNRCYGVLIVDLGLSGGDPGALEPWQERLLDTLAGNLGTALQLHERMRQGRRLALHEERGILARELHDSLAQSLTYLKIQATRLAMALDQNDQSQAQTVVGELREGISSAYRQLRELLTTFRLKMDERGLNGALEATVEEFRARGSTVVELDNRLPAALLTPNEEIHVLQIVREALSNVIRHADAQHAWVRLVLRGDLVEVEIVDDGRGIGARDQGVRHYGHSIMRERAQTLGGELELTSAVGGGTRLRLRFHHRSSNEAEAGALVARALAPVSAAADG